MDSVPRLRMTHVILPLLEVRPPQQQADERRRKVHRPLRTAGSGRRSLRPHTRAVAEVNTPLSAEGAFSLGVILDTGETSALRSAAKKIY